MAFEDYLTTILAIPFERIRSKLQTVLELRQLFPGYRPDDAWYQGSLDGLHELKRMTLAQGLFKIGFVRNKIAKRYIKPAKDAKKEMIVMLLSQRNAPKKLFERDGEYQGLHELLCRNGKPSMFKMAKILSVVAPTLAGVIPREVITKAIDTMHHTLYGDALHQSVIATREKVKECSDVTAVIYWLALKIAVKLQKQNDSAVP